MRQPEIVGAARFDRSGRYRYVLSRQWDPRRPRIAFVMLNPNRADASRDDPTIRRCVRFAHAWGFGALDVVNLFALCAARPALLAGADDPVGPRNDRFVGRVCGAAALTVAAWGIHGARLGRDLAVQAQLRRRGVALYCLGVTRNGHPCHPLYLPADRRLQPFAPA